MGSFQTGFAQGQSMMGFALDHERKKAEDERRAEAHRVAMELQTQQLAAGKRTARINDELDQENAGIRTMIHGGFEQGAAGPQDEAAAMYGVNAGSSMRAPMDPNNPDDQVGLNRRLMSAAAIKGDYKGITELQEKNRQLAEQRVFNAAVQQFSMNPDSFTEYTRWVNKNNPMITTSPAKDPRTGQLTGYNIMTVTPSGDAAHKFISPQQAAILAGATALMRVNPAKAIELIGQVDQSLAQSIAAQNSATKDTVTTGNTAAHNMNQDATSQMNAVSNRMQAGASVTNARANQARASREKQTEAEKLQEKVDAYAGILMRQNPKLTKAEADKQAAGIILRDPNAKEQDVGLSEAGIFRVGKKYFRMNNDNEPEEVRFDGSNATLDALRALQEKGVDPFAPKPKKGREASGKVTEDR